MPLDMPTGNKICQNSIHDTPANLLSAGVPYSHLADNASAGSTGLPSQQISREGSLLFVLLLGGPLKSAQDALPATVSEEPCVGHAISDD